MDYHRQNRVNIRIVRIFNTYGPRMHPFDGRVVSNFIRQALAGEDITIFGDGSQTRSFCYRDDLIEGMIRMMNGPDDFIGPVNLGNPGEFTILELAELVIELTGSRSKLIYQPLPVDDPTQRQPDITLAKTASRLEPDGSASRRAAEDDRVVPLDRPEPLPPADAELLAMRFTTRGSSVTRCGTPARRASKGNLLAHPRLRFGLVFGGEHGLRRRCLSSFATDHRRAAKEGGQAPWR